MHQENLGKIIYILKLCLGTMTLIYKTLYFNPKQHPHIEP